MDDVRESDSIAPPASAADAARPTAISPLRANDRCVRFMHVCIGKSTYAATSPHSCAPHHRPALAAGCTAAMTASPAPLISMPRLIADDGLAGQQRQQRETRRLRYAACPTTNAPTALTKPARTSMHDSFNPAAPRIGPPTHPAAANNTSTAR